ncbi:MAG: undecaprenyl-diphosphate phosphatase [Candidatus Krumholzibacteria bacterium]|jgi:undecaprenyl-diphosphatase|nr:undecaprenyl-diphosphate phosphatase [Candidatus Krumholzibacteria bacterium]MDP6669231.1 undecaprenyl-diphosphate phosphatase [Candidatus Krumholzibacteria bacterium]MDP6796474.1 undecaprenyl-diphosphate phosphatase [Candidatus Krumholzibacteria bacterium]MDP7021604.1 undecaprenyl-diphosphate phosphatase [Candidatus Krumholzibacteria bacterium]
MNLWQSILLGLIQGLTEFLPVSSSGHLTLFGAFLGVSRGGGDPYRFFVVMTHFGTLMAILIYYRRDLWGLLVSLFRSLPRLSRPREEDRPRLRLIGILALATLPAVLAGLLLDDWIAGLFEKPLPAAVFLSVTGLILLSSRWTSARASGEAGYRSGFLVGLAQALAILPGISRSGSTIAMGLAMGIRREEAARFAFLLAVPVLFGAALFDSLKIESLAMVDWPVILAGTFTAFVSGYLALIWLIRLLQRESFWKFSWYCWGASLVALGMILLG